MSVIAELPVSMLICSLCRDLYRQPRTLPCLHSFCHQCLLQLPLTERDEGRSVFDCPQCRQLTFLPLDGVSGFLLNEFLARLCRNYVGDVEKTLASSSRPLSPGPQSPRSPPPVSSPTLPDKGASPLGQHSISLSNLSREEVVPPLSHLPPFPGATTFSSDARRGSAPMATLSSSCINLVSPSQSGQLAAGGVLSDQMISSHAIGMQRRLTATPPEVAVIYEELQRRFNSLQSASLQISYSLENINQAEQKWHQKKQYLKRDVQRRSAELQFFIKRQERLMLALLESKDMDDGFITTADKARDDLRSSLRALAQQRNIVKTVLDFATDPELISLGGMLLDKTISMDPVAMISPELMFSIPERGLSVEDMMERDFGSLTTTLVTHKIFTPEDWELDLDEEQLEEEEEEELQQQHQQQKQQQQQQQQQEEDDEDEEEEGVVTEIYDMKIPQAVTTSTTIVEQSVPTAAILPSDRVESHSVNEPICNITIEEEPIQEVDQEVEHEEQQKEEEEEDEEEVMIVEEICEIVNGEMRVISRTVRPASQTMSASNKEEETDASKNHEEEEEDDGIVNHQKEDTDVVSEPIQQEERHSKRAAELTSGAKITACVIEKAEEQTTSSATPKWRSNIDIGQQGTVVHNDETSTNGDAHPQTASSVATETITAKVKTVTFNTQNGSRSPTHGVEPVENAIQRVDGVADTTTKEESSSETEIISEHMSTLNRFQSFRESLRKRRRELLSSTMPSGSGDQDPNNLLRRERERRGQSLERSAAYMDPISLSHLAALEQQQASMVTVRDSSLPRRSTEGRSRATGTMKREGGGGAAAPSEDISASSEISPTMSLERRSRPVRRAISAASDKASKVEFLKETWRKRRELLIQNDAFSVYNPNVISSQDDDPLRGNDGNREGLRAGLTNMSDTLKRSGKAEEGVLQPRTPRGNLADAGGAIGITLPLLTPTPTSAAAGRVADTQALKTVDSILQRKNIVIPEPKSPQTPPLSPNYQQVSHTAISTIGSKPSMMVKPLLRDPSSMGATCAQFSSPLETLQEDESRTAEFAERRHGLRSTSPTRSGEDGSKDVMLQVKAKMRRKKERWRSLSLT